MALVVLLARRKLQQIFEKLRLKKGLLKTIQADEGYEKILIALRIQSLAIFVSTTKSDS